jgi:hypothetical protein
LVAAKQFVFQSFQAVIGSPEVQEGFLLRGIESLSTLRLG